LINYTLQPFARREFVVVNSYGDRVGTIRQLSPSSWGWRDMEGLHEYPSRDNAAAACLASAIARQKRQNSRRWKFENAAT
jgi:hypothetical protein